MESYIQRTYNVSANNVIKWRINSFNVFFISPIQLCNLNGTKWCCKKKIIATYIREAYQ